MRAAWVAVALVGCSFSAPAGDVGSPDAKPDGREEVVDAPVLPVDAVASDLVAYYSMEVAPDEANPLADVTGNRHDGTCASQNWDCPEPVSGVFGQGLAFDGDLVAVADAIDVRLAAGTVAMWIAFDALPPDDEYVCPLGKIDDSPHHNQNSWQVCLRGIDGNWIWQVFVQEGMDEPSFVAPAPVVAGGWQHVAIAWTSGAPGDQMVLVVDGVQLGAIELPEPLAYDNGPITIGADRNFPDILDVPLEGRMDDLRIYSRSLSPAELMTLATPP